MNKRRPIIKNNYKLSLPKISQPFDKMQQANLFIADPQITNLNDQQNYQTKQKPQEKIKKRAKLIHHLTQQQGIPADKIIKKKMKKYQPVNSSFTIFYGQKVQMDHREFNADSKKFSTDINIDKLKLHQLMSKNQSIKTSRINSNRNQHRTKPLSLDRRILSQQYVKKLKQIRNLSSILKEQSQIIIHKTQDVEKYMQKKYLKLLQSSQQIITGSKHYKLEQQTSNIYKKQLQQMWMRSDTRRR